MSSFIAIVDANEKSARSAAEVLSPHFATRIFASSADFFSGLAGGKPLLIVIGSNLEDDAGVNFARRLKQGDLANIPALYVYESGGMRTLDVILDLNIKYITRPYTPATLLGAVMPQIRGAVESSWQSLPLTQRKVLEGSLRVFDKAVDRILQGQPLDLSSVEEPCAALVEVVNAGEFEKVLSSMKWHDNVTFVHCLRMATFLTLFGRAIGLSKDQQMVMASGGLLHDIGKLRLPLAILNKNGPLTELETEKFESHVKHSLNILSSSFTLPNGVTTIVGCHHERLDGSGYPLGLKADGLNKLARLAAIADVFTTLTDRRPNRSQLTAGAAIEIMVNEMAEQLDSGLVSLFKEVLLETGTGQTPQ